MKLFFYSSSRKPDCREIEAQWAQLVYDDKEDNRNDEEYFYEERLLSGRKVFSEYGNDVDDAYDIEIAKLIEKYHPEVVILASYYTLLKAAEDSEKVEINTKHTVNDRHLIYYTLIGSDNCALIVAVK